MIFFLKREAIPLTKKIYSKKQYSVVTTELWCHLEQHILPLCVSIFLPTVFTIHIIRSLGQRRSLCLHSSLCNGVVSLLGPLSGVGSKI